MKKVFLSFFCILLLTSCDYKVPLVKKPNIKIDNNIIGLWQRKNNQGKTEKLLVLPISEYEYFVAYPLGSNSMFAKACFCSIDNKKIIQIKWFGTAKCVLPKDDRAYQYSEIILKNNKLAIKMLNTDIVNKEVSSSTELSNAIKENINNPNLFHNQMNFEKTIEKK